MNSIRTDISGNIQRARRRRYFNFVTVGFLMLAVLTSILIHLVPKVNAEGGYHWTEQTSVSWRIWRSIASSADGTKLAAVEADNSSNNSSHIYTSTDSGATWVDQANADSRTWYSIASNADGTKLVAVDYGGYIYTSSDSGVTWTQQVNSGSRNWLAVTSSADGTKLAAIVDYGEYIYTSSDSGVTWTQQTSSGSRNWRSIASSADGTKLAAVADNIYTSTDAGATWTEQTTSDGSHTWSAITSSADGTKLVAANADQPGNVYASIDSGVSWESHPVALAGSHSAWNTIASSADGTRLVIADQNYGNIYTSFDSGASWYAQSTVGIAPWLAVSTNSAGTSIMAGGNLTRLWRATFSGPESPGAIPIPGLNAGGDIQLNSILVTWPNGVDDGGSPITDYRVDYSSDGGSTWSTFQHTPLASDANSITVTGLSASTDYVFRVSAVNAVGMGPWSTTEAATATGAAPSAPLNFSASAGDSKAIVAWAPPTTNGGSLVTAYELQYKQKSSAIWQIVSSTLPPSTGSYIVSGLTNGVGYDFRVRAINAIGASSWSSNDSAAWRLQYIPAIPQQVASSADGTKLIVDGGSNLYTSIDSGHSWVVGPDSGSSGGWNTVASSIDGTKLVAAQWNGSLYTSVDTGATWTERPVGATGSNWDSVSTSADGTVIYAVNDDDGIYKSLDGGATWALIAPGSAAYWVSVAAVGNTSTVYGIKLDYSASQSILMKSTDGGQTWANTGYQASFADNPGTSVSTSSDGRVVVLSGNAKVSVSKDFGQTWSTVGIPEQLLRVGYASVDPAGSSIYLGGINTLGMWSIITDTAIVPVGSISTNPPIDGGTGATSTTVPASKGTSPSISSSSIPTAPVNSDSTTDTAQQIVANNATLTNGSVIDARPTFSGRANPFDTITVTVHSNPVSCTTQADGNGFWNCTLPTSLPAGSHTVLVQAVAAVDGVTRDIASYSVQVLAKTGSTSDKNTAHKPQLSQINKQNSPTVIIILGTIAVLVVVGIIALFAMGRRRARRGATKYPS